MRVSCLFSFIFIFFSNLSVASENEPVRSKEEVTGCWELYVFSDEAKKLINMAEPWPAKYQYYCFFDDGTLSSLATSKPAGISASVLRETLEKLPKDITYEIPKEGVMVTRQPSSNQNLAWSAEIYTDSMLFDGVVVGKGTLVMWLFSEKYNKVYYHRYLKRMK